MSIIDYKAAEGCHKNKEVVMDKLLLRVPEAAEMAGISRSVAYQLLASGAWPKVIVGSSIRVPVAGLKEWVERETAQASTSRPHHGSVMTSVR